MTNAPLDAVAHRDFRGWHGFPATTAYADFDARFPRLVEAHAIGLLGTTHQRAEYRVHTATGYPQNLRAWYRDGRLLVVDAKLPQLTHPLPDLLTDLGEPAARLDARWDVLDVPGGLRVHPERGIALFVGPEAQLLRVVLFPACDLDQYLRTVHHEDRLTERPLPD